MQQHHHSQPISGALYNNHIVLLRTRKSYRAMEPVLPILCKTDITVQPCREKHSHSNMHLQSTLRQRTSMYLECGKKPEYPKETYLNTEKKTCKHYAERPHWATCCSFHKTHEWLKLLFCWLSSFTLPNKSGVTPVKAKPVKADMWFGFDMWHELKENESSATSAQADEPKWYFISLLFLMQIRPVWVNRHIHGFFHTTLV